MARLEIRNLSKKYNNASDYIIKNLDLNVEKGELLTLLGKSGCGKTTLLRLLCGFESHSEGEIILNEKVISNDSIWIPPEKRNIGMVFQDYALFPNMTAWGNVAFAVKKKKKCISKTDKMLKLMEIYDVKDKYPHQLSGGQQQRVAIARALIRKPDILLLDEPFSNLDLDIRETVREEMQRILRKVNSTVILVTHDQKEALSISQRIAILHDGKIQQIATPYEIYNNPVNIFVAEFVGKANIYKGIVEDANTILCKFGTVLSKSNIPHRKGTPVKFMIRPENVIISNEGKMKGVITRYNYAGTHYDVVISVNNPNNLELQLSAILSGEAELRLNEEIRFDLYIKSCHNIFLD
jgi:iron(III) transport system ATP-binding protein